MKFVATMLVVAGLVFTGCGCQGTEEVGEAQEVIVPAPTPDPEPLVVHEFAVGDEVVLVTLSGDEYNAVIDELLPDGSYAALFDVTRETEEGAILTLTIRMTEIPAFALRKRPVDVIPVPNKK